MSTDPTPQTQPMPDAEVAAEAVAAEAVAAEAVAAEAIAAEAVAAEPAATEAGAGEAPAAAEGAGVAPAVPVAAAPARRTGTVALAWGRRFLRLAFTVALLSFGVALGWQTYLNSRPAAVIVGDPAVAGVPTPEIVAELAQAIEADDSDAIRAALSPQIFSSYAADLQSFGIARVESVDTLGTYQDGSRTATELVLHGRDAQRTPFSINLVVLTQDGSIVRLR